MWRAGRLDVPLDPDTERRLRALLEARQEAERAGRAEAGRRFSEVIAEPRRRFLAAVLDAVDERGASKADIARAFDVSPGLVWQWVRDARAEFGGTQ